MIENSSDKKFIETDQRNNPLMTLKTIKFFCQKQSLPSQPQLNDTLYLQYKGFQKIIPESISLFINLGTLYLNNNCIHRIEGLHMLRQLKNLYLNNNFIQKIEGLEQLYNLRVLNLAHNKLDLISGLDDLQNLRNLNLAQNFLTKPKDLEGLIHLTKITELNLSQNQIEASEQMFDTITQIQNLTILYLKSTPFSNFMKNYRKRITQRLKKLKFLDNRPILPRDHQLAEAWIQGGTEKQKQLKQKMMDSNRQERQKQMWQQTKKGQQKLNQQRHKLTETKPIAYQQSSKPSDQSGLNSSYLPKKETRLQAYLSRQVPQVPKKATPSNKQTTQPQSAFNIYKQVQSVLCSDKLLWQQQQQVKTRRSLGKKWDKKYQKLLQQLLMKYKFDFSEVQPSLNMVISNVSKKLVRPAIRFEINELRLIWTEIQIKKRIKIQTDLIINVKNYLPTHSQINETSSLYQKEQ